MRICICDQIKWYALSPKLPVVGWSHILDFLKPESMEFVAGICTRIWGQSLSSRVQSCVAYV